MPPQSVMPRQLPPLPAAVARFNAASVTAQLIPWHLTPDWTSLLGSHPQLLAALQNEVATHGGIRRSFVHQYAKGDPVGLFLLAMAWGFGETSYGAVRVRRML